MLVAWPPATFAQSLPTACAHGAMRQGLKTNCLQATRAESAALPKRRYESIILLMTSWWQREADSVTVEHPALIDHIVAFTHSMPGQRKLSCFDAPQPSRKDTSVTRFRGSVALEMG